MEKTTSQKKKKISNQLTIFFSNDLGERNKLKPKPAGKKEENYKYQSRNQRNRKKNRENQPKVGSL